MGWATQTIRGFALKSNCATSKSVSEGFLAPRLRSDASGYVRTKKLAVRNKINKPLTASATSIILAVARKPTPQSNLDKGLASFAKLRKAQAHRKGGMGFQRFQPVNRQSHTSWKRWKPMPQQFDAILEVPRPSFHAKTINPRSRAAKASTPRRFRWLVAKKSCGKAKLCWTTHFISHNSPCVSCRLV